MSVLGSVEQMTWLATYGAISNTIWRGDDNWNNAAIVWNLLRDLRHNESNMTDHLKDIVREASKGDL